MEYKTIGRWSREDASHNYTARAIDNIGRILAKVGADVDIDLEQPLETVLEAEQIEKIEAVIDETLKRIIKIRHKRL